MVGCIRQGGLEFYQTLVAKYVYPWRTSFYEFLTTKRRLFSLLGETSSVWLELVNIPSDTNRTKVMESDTLRSYLLLRAAIFVFGAYWRREMSLVRVWTSRATVACRYIYVNILLTPVYLCRGDGSFIISPQGEDMLCFRIVPSAGNSAVE